MGVGVGVGAGVGVGVTSRTGQQASPDVRNMPKANIRAILTILTVYLLY